MSRAYWAAVRRVAAGGALPLDLERAHCGGWQLEAVESDYETVQARSGVV